jgi:hypothetical protein
MMALMLRNASHLFDVCLLLLFVDRAACASELFVWRTQAGAPPKFLGCSPPMPPRKFYAENLAAISLSGDAGNDFEAGFDPYKQAGARVCLFRGRAG